MSDLAPDGTLRGSFVPDSTPRVQTVTGGGFEYHTEPRLLNHAVNTHGVENIEEITMLTERAPCTSSCRPQVLPSWRSGSVTPGSQNVPLTVYDGSGADHW